MVYTGTQAGDKAYLDYRAGKITHDQYTTAHNAQYYDDSIAAPTLSEMNPVLMGETTPGTPKVGVTPVTGPPGPVTEIPSAYPDIPPKAGPVPPDSVGAIQTAYLNNTIDWGEAYRRLTQVLGIDPAQAERELSLWTAEINQPPSEQLGPGFTGRLGEDEILNPLLNQQYASPPDLSELRRQQEAREGGLAASFRQWLQQMPGFNRLSGLGQAAIEERYDPMRRTYKWGGTAFTPEADTGLFQTFADWLERGGRAQTPTEMMTTLQKRAGEYRAGSTSPMFHPEEGLGSNVQAYAAFLAPYLQGVAPIVRGAAEGSAQALFDRYQSQSMGKSFLDYIAGLGGFQGAWRY